MFDHGQFLYFSKVENVIQAYRHVYYFNNIYHIFIDYNKQKCRSESFLKYNDLSYCYQIQNNIKTLKSPFK